jgi:hypothetical protein
MNIPNIIFIQLRISLSNDDHILNEPVELKFAANCCKSCGTDTIDVMLQCSSFREKHEKT